MLLYFQLRWLKTFLLKSNKSHHFHDTWNLKHANHATSSLLMFVKSTLQVPTLHLLRGCMDTTEEAKNVRSPSELCGKKMIPKWDLFDTPAISKTSKKIHHIYIYIYYIYVSSCEVDTLCPQWTRSFCRAQRFGKEAKPVATRSMEGPIETTTQLSCVGSFSRTQEFCNDLSEK